MHILYLHQYFVAPDGSGGTRSFEMARRWVDQGHRVTLITSSARYNPGPRGVVHRTQHSGIEIVVLPVDYSSEMSHAQRVRAFLSFAARATAWTLTSPADVVFASSTPLTIAIPAIVSHRLRATPMVFEVRDAWPELPIAMGALRNPVAIWAARALESAACRTAADVIALSPGMAQSVHRCGVHPSRVHVIPNACDIDAFDVDPHLARAFVQQRIPGDAPLVVYAGSFGAINDAAWLVDVAAATPHVRFAFVGAGPGGDEIRARARARGLLGDRVHILPPIAKQEVPLLLRGAQLATSLFLPIPQMEHNSANKFFDALAAGVPVAINYGGWQAQLLEQSGAGVVLPRGDVGAAGRVISQAVADPLWAARASRAARSLARSTFDRDTLAQRALAVLEHAAAR